MPEARRTPEGEFLRLYAGGPDAMAQEYANWEKAKEAARKAREEADNAEKSARAEREAAERARETLAAETLQAGRDAQERREAFEADMAVREDALKQAQAALDSRAAEVATEAEGVKTMVAHLKGQPIQPRVDTGVTIVTPENLDSEASKALLSPPLAEFLP